MNNLGYVKVTKQGEDYFYSYGEGIGNEFWGDQGYTNNIKNFREIPELNAVINYRARAESQIQLDIVSKETGKSVKNNEPLVRTLRNPNWFQSQKEYWFQTVLNRCIFGNEYHYFLTPTGMGSNFKGMFVLPSDCVYITAKAKRFYLESKEPEDVQYFFKYWQDSEYYVLPKKDLIHLNDNRVGFRVDETDQKEIRQNYMYGTSKIESLTPALENIKVSYEGRNTLRKLPVGILSNENRDGMGAVGPMSDTKKKELQEDLRKYGLNKKQYQLIITSMALKMNETVIDIDKLKLFDEVKEDTAKICDAFGVPYELLGNQTGVTYENKKEAKRQLYQDTVIPSAMERIQAFNKYLGTDDKSWEIVGSYNHLPIFQENQKERAASLNLLIGGLNKAFQDGALAIDDYKKELAKYGIGKN